MRERNSTSHRLNNIAGGLAIGLPILQKMAWECVDIHPPCEAQVYVIEEIRLKFWFRFQF
jgi:hypothetical protein